MNVHKGQNKKQIFANYAEFWDLVPSICGRFQIKDVENKHKKKICSKEPIMYPNLFAFYRCKTERLPKSPDNGCLNLKNFELREATIFFLQPVTKYFILPKVRKSGNTGEVQKTLISAFS